MSQKNPTNIPASIRARLLNRAKNDQRPFEELLQYYAMERFLYRLSKSKHANRFILEGALMFKVWKSSLHRPSQKKQIFQHSWISLLHTYGATVKKV